MVFRSSRDLKLILHPVAFVLKGGKEMKENPLDYELMMLRINSTETIKSPPNFRQIPLTTRKVANLIKAPIVPQASSKEQGCEV